MFCTERCQDFTCAFFFCYLALILVVEKFCPGKLTAAITGFPCLSFTLSAKQNTWITTWNTQQRINAVQALRITSKIHGNQFTTTVPWTASPRSIVQRQCLHFKTHLEAISRSLITSLYTVLHRQCY